MWLCVYVQRDTFYFVTRKWQISCVFFVLFFFIESFLLPKSSFPAWKKRKEHVIMLKGWSILENENSMESLTRIYKFRNLFFEFFFSLNGFRWIGFKLRIDYIYFVLSLNFSYFFFFHFLGLLIWVSSFFLVTFVKRFVFFFDFHWRIQKKDQTA